MRKLLHAVKGWINGKSPVKEGHTAIVYVYGSGKDGDINPNDQINILRRLSSFTDKENLPITVIFPGRPSRKIPDGAKQGLVEVRYATGDQMSGVVTKAVAAAKKSHIVALAVNRPELEKWARSNRVRHIRATTFEKSLDTICGPLRRDQPQQQQRQQSQRQPQGQGQGQGGQGQPQSQPQPPSQDGAPAESQEQGTEPAADTPAESTPVDTPAPAPRQESSRKLHRHDPYAKKEERDQAILDLIDPL